MSQPLQARSNTNTSRTQADNWFSYCEGDGQNAAGQHVYEICDDHPAHSLMYLSVGEAYITNTGVSADIPYGGQCGTTPNSWKNASQESWFLHGAGTSVAAANRIANLQDQGIGADSSYTWFINAGDTSPGGYVAYLQSYINNCTLANGAIINKYWGLRWDDVFPGLTMKFQYFLNNEPNGDANIGQNRGTKDIDGDNNLPNPACTNLYSGKTCTGAPYISANGASTLEYTTRMALDNSYTTLANALVHADGTTPYNVVFNGQLTTDTNLLSNGTNVLAGVEESPISSCCSGNIQSAQSIATSLDNCAAVVNNTTKIFAFLDYGDQSISDAGFWRIRRLHRAALMLCFKDNQVESWSGFDNSRSNYVNVWPEDFLYPTDPLTNMAAPTGCTFDNANPTCSSGGAHSLLFSGSYPAGVYVREFNHCWYNAAFTTASGADESGCAFVLNLSSSPFTVTGLSNPYNHLITPCTPTGGTYAVPTCSGVTNGDVGGQSGGVAAGAVGTGPGTLDFKFFPFVAGTTRVPSMDAVWLTSK